VELLRSEIRKVYISVLSFDNSKTYEFKMGTPLGFYGSRRVVCDLPSFDPTYAGRASARRVKPEVATEELGELLEIKAAIREEVLGRSLTAEEASTLEEAPLTDGERLKVALTVLGGISFYA